jgi:hypothetical protein
MTTKTRKKTIWVKVGNCATDRRDVIEGATYDPEKRHNCLDCGYMNRYNDEMIEIDPKTNTVLWSSVK